MRLNLLAIVTNHRTHLIHASDGKAALEEAIPYTLRPAPCTLSILHTS